MTTQVQYEAEVFIGSPSQHVSLILDTTYPYFVVDHPKCEICTASKRFNPEDSITYAALGDTGFSADVVAFQPNATYHLYNQTVVVNTQHSERHYKNADGLFVSSTQGLGFEHPHRGNPHFLARLQHQGIIQDAVFAVALNDMEMEEGDSESSVSFGAWNLSKFSAAEDFVYTTALIDRDYWEISVEHAAFGEEHIQTDRSRAILDTSQPFLFLPVSVYDKFYATLCTRLICNRPNNDWPCEKGYPKHMPDLHIFSTGVRFTLTSRDYFVRSNGQCYLNVKPGHQWILGISFHQKYYTLFDLDRRRIGFAERLAVQKSSLGMTLLLAGLLILAAVVVVVKQHFCPKDKHVRKHGERMKEPLVQEHHADYRDELDQIN